jgi:hypothetical protein
MIVTPGECDLLLHLLDRQDIQRGGPSPDSASLRDKLTEALRRMRALEVWMRQRNPDRPDS